jgi:hypothetical protein
MQQHTGIGIGIGRDGVGRLAALVVGRLTKPKLLVTQSFQG